MTFAQRVDGMRRKGRKVPNVVDALCSYYCHYYPQHSMHWHLLVPYDRLA